MCWNYSLCSRIVWHFHLPGIPYTKLIKQNLSSIILINRVERLLRCLYTHVEAEVAQAAAKFTEIDPPVISGVDVIKHGPQLVEVHDVDQQSGELFSLDPRIAIPTPRPGCGVLVRAHQGRFVVAELPEGLLHTHFVDLCQTDFVVCVEV